jgi:alkanesulfonate monooxygenase SsuD/methylene tetrahydromethanopterin reductase-like flavin-dependent oxidoreductase (luciferase family)
MKFGLFSMNAYACSFPENAVSLARLAEEAGFESLWASTWCCLIHELPSRGWLPKNVFLIR